MRVGRADVKQHAFLISSLHRGERSALRGGRFNLLSKRRLFEPQSHSGRCGEGSAKRTSRLSADAWLLGLQRDTRLWCQKCRQGGKELERACLVIAVVLMIS